MQSQSTIGAKAASGDIFRELGKLARQAGEVLDASSSLLGQAQALVRTGIEDSRRVSAALIEMQQRLEVGATLRDQPPVSAKELSVATAAARELALRSAEMVLQVHSLIGRESIVERYCWGDGPPGPTMIELHACLDALVKWGGEAAAGHPVIKHKIQSMERGFLTMRNVARHHLELADHALRTAELLQGQALHFVRKMEGA